MSQTCGKIYSVPSQDYVASTAFKPLSETTFLKINLQSDKYLTFLVGKKNHERLAGTHMPSRNVAEYIIEIPPNADTFIIKNSQETSIDLPEEAFFSLTRTIDNPLVKKQMSRKDLVLIHALGKVGTITIEKALSKHLDKIDLVRTHHLVPHEFNSKASIHEAHFSKQVLSRTREGKTFILTGLRDVYEMCLSSFFQNYGSQLLLFGAESSAVFEFWKKGLSAQIDHYDNWWKHEFFNFYRIEQGIFLSHLDQFNGYVEFQHKGRCHIIYSIGTVDQAIVKVAEKIRADVEVSKSHNEASEKDYHLLYKQTLAHLKSEPFRVPLPTFIGQLQSFL